MAGRRGGLDGARSGLFWHQCRIADSVAAPWVLWENVAGAFSSNDGADFAAVLWGLTGTLPGVPDGGWRTAGVVVGPKRTAVWRLLDARWFGVAQRRRRVFVVAGPRGACGPEVLLEPEGVRGNPEPGGEAGQVAATSAGDGTDLGRRDGFVTSLTLSGVSNPDDNSAQAGHPLAWTKVGHGQWADGVGTLRARDHEGDSHVVMSFHPTQDPGVNAVDVCHSLGTTNPPAGVAVPIDMRNALRESTAGETTGLGIGEDGDPMFTLTGHTMGRPAVATDLEVRRLTPRECERLMGWPDDHTRWTDTGAEIADSHRYRMCGNGVVAPVAEWIGRRILEAGA